MKFLSDLKSNKRKILENKQFLKKGTYVLLPNMRTYVRLFGEKNAKRNFPTHQRGVKHCIYRFISLFFLFRVKTNGEFSGDIVYFSTCPDDFNRDCKVFSSDKKQVLFICANEVRYNLYMNNRKRVESAFEMPTLIDSDSEKFYIIEEYIDHTQKETDSVKITERLFEFYDNYYSREDNKVLSSEHPEYLCDGITAEQCPHLYLHHADLSKDNLIFVPAQDRLLFIDFDHENYYPPFYDIMFFILNQHFSCGDSAPLELLLSGEYDSYINSYAKKNTINPYALIDACVACLTEKRFFTYSSEQKNEIKAILEKINRRLSDV